MVFLHSSALHVLLKEITALQSHDMPCDSKTESCKSFQWDLSCFMEHFMEYILNHFHSGDFGINSAFLCNKMFRLCLRTFRRAGWSHLWLTPFPRQSDSRCVTNIRKQTVNSFKPWRAFMRSVKRFNLGVWAACCWLWKYEQFVWTLKQKYPIKTAEVVFGYVDIVACERDSRHAPQCQRLDLAGSPRPRRLQRHWQCGSWPVVANRGHR